MAVDLKLAREFAREAHKDQVRKHHGGPYIDHPIRVAEELERLGAPDYVIAAGYLHDVVEDTEITNEEIEKIFGDRTAHLVAEVTDVYTHEAYPQHNRKTRKKRERERERSFWAMVLKVIDHVDNEQDMPADDNFSKLYVAEGKEMFDEFRARCFGMKDVEQIVRKSLCTTTANQSQTLFTNNMSAWQYLGMA